MFRDFAYQDTKDIGKNYLRNLKKCRIAFSNDDLSFAELEFLIWGYSLQFFTISWAAKQLDMNSNNFANRYIYPLVSKGYVYKHFDRLTPSDTYEDHLFRDETKYNYRVRYAITQKARINVQAFYRKMES
tara:strand:- start:271 stop:660 length:390 start_codon:yes stop_codon:yes gene_type:complete